MGIPFYFPVTNPLFSPTFLLTSTIRQERFATAVIELSLSDLADADLAYQAARQPAQPNTAFAELYRRHVDQVYRYLLARTGSIHDAQDITSQTFLAALEGIKHYRGKAGFISWIFGIARRKLADHYRDHYGTKNALSLDDAENAPQTALLPDDIVNHHLQMERIVLALQAIAPDRAEALTLHIFGELTAAEVGQVMGKSEAAVRMLVHRALGDLRVRLVYKEQADG
jgi:RNA polymerase sigma-70 factor, ECF subfamily